MRRITQLLAVLMIVIGIVGIFMTGGDLMQTDTEGRETFSGEEIDQLIVDSNIANIELHPSDSKDMEVVWEGNLRNHSHRVHLQQDESTLMVDVDTKEPFFLKFFSFFDFLNKLTVKIYLPDKIFSNISVENEVGNTLISSVHADKFYVKSDVSNIEMTDVQTEELIVESDVGNIQLDDVTGVITAKSDVGNMTLKLMEITNDIQLTSDVGKISVQLSRIPDNVSFQGYSDVGSIRIFGESGNYINRNAEYMVDMKTDVGKIDVYTR